MSKRRIGALTLGAVLAVALSVALFRAGRSLPPNLSGALVFVSDRDGTEALYWRRLPRSRPRRLTQASEPVRDPALAPDGTRVAFGMGGRIGTVTLATGDVRVVTLGVDFRDAMPAWLPDGQGLVVSTRRSKLPGDGRVARHPLTQTRGLDDTSPVVSPIGNFVVFVREDHLWRVSLEDGRTVRLTGGFRKSRAPRFLPSGRLVCLWSEGKQHGIDVLDADGKNRETLWQGSIYYRTIAPSPDGRYFAVTFTYDLAFHPADALKMRQTEEVRLLDLRGQPAAILERSGRFSNHSPDWGR